MEESVQPPPAEGPPSNRPREAAAWAAGFFDGEGWACSARYARKDGGMTASPVLGVGQKEPELLERFRQIVGVGRVQGPDCRGMYCYRTHGLANIERVAGLLWPVARSPKARAITGRTGRRQTPRPDPRPAAL